MKIPRRKVWLMPTAQVPCSNAANVGDARLECKVKYAPGKIPLGAGVLENLHVPAQEMAKHCAKFGGHAYFSMHMHETGSFLLQSEIWHHHRVPAVTPISYKMRKFK